MTLQSNHKTGFFGSVGFVIAAASATAYAQDGAQRVLEEVTVTAQKRAEDLQEVPVAVSAASAEMLAGLGIENVLEVEQVIPGLTYTTNAAQASPRIRGIGTSISAAGNEQAVATYVDGVYYASALGSIMSFNNIEQVAVLKGPQGTLFGRNTTGGLIQVTTRDPGQEFAGEAELLYGNLDTIGADLYLSGGISDSAAADVAIHYKDQKEGFGTNLFNGRDVNRGDELSIRSKWLVALGADTNATFIADYSDSKSTGAIFRTKPGELPITGLPGPAADFDTNTNSQPFSDIKQYGSSLKLTHDFQTMQFLSISAYRHTDWETLFDSDGHQAFILRARVSEPDRQVSQEFQLLSTGGGPLQWVVGAYYFDASGGFLPGIVDVVPSGLINTLFSKQKTESYSVFGQGSYAISDATSVTVGLRWTTEDKSIDGSGTLFFPATGFTVPVGPIAAKETIDEPTYRLAIDHQLTALLRLYPRAWRERYGDEFLAFVADSELSWRAVADVIAAAMAERVRAVVALARHEVDPTVPPLVAAGTTREAFVEGGVYMALVCLTVWALVPLGVPLPPRSWWLYIFLQWSNRTPRGRLDGLNGRLPPSSGSPRLPASQVSDGSQAAC